MATAKAAGAAAAATSKYAAKVRTQLSSPSTWNNVWTSRLTFLLYNLAVPLAFYFKPLCVLAALLWLILRASKILLTPLPTLSALLGFDIPPAPLLSLASISSNSCILHWSLPAENEKPKPHKSQLKYEIYLNGALVGDVGVNDSAVVLSGLRSETFYVVRVGLVFGEICSKSGGVRFRTKAASAGAEEGGGEVYHAVTDGHETDSDAVQTSMPRVRPYRALKDFTPATPTSAAMTREPSAGLSGGKMGSRRPSPGALGIDPDAENPFTKAEAPVEPSSTIQELTTKLENFRHENEELEKQAKKDEEEEARQKEELNKERDALKHQFAEREKASKSLRKDIGQIERQNTVAQNEKSKVERALFQKKQERQKLKNDVLRWEREAEEMKADETKLRHDHAVHLDEKAAEKRAQQERLEEETAEVRTLDERVKAKTAEVKALERTIKDSSPSASSPPSEGQQESAEPTILQQQQAEAEEDKKWFSLRTTLQQQYQMAYNKLDAAKRFHAEQYRYLESLRAERRRQDEAAVVSSQFASPTILDRVPRRGDSRRSRASISDSPRLGAFPINNQPPLPAGINTTTAAGGFNRFFNYQNGMTLNTNGPSPTNEVAMSMSDEERLQLTGGAAMSPSAGADLIPADLFSGDGDRGLAQEYVQPLPGLGSLPNLPGLPGLPGAGGPYAAPGGSQLQQQEQTGAAGGANGPASPAASSSRSASVFASPQASQPNLILGPGSPELGMTIDPDRRSIRSTRSTRAPSGGATTTGSRFSGMFGIKQRKGNVADDTGGLPLSKASSMPRQDQILSGLDSASRKRNSSLSGPAFGNIDSGMDGTGETSTTAPRRTFGLFGKDKGIIGGGWPSNFTAFGRRPVSPRPGSTHSTELPRPSLDGGNSGGRWGADAWPSNDNSAVAAAARGSPLAFGDGWGQSQTQTQQQGSRLFGSRHPSRRPSVQYGATGPPDDILEGDDDEFDYEDDDVGEGRGLAPIGTKPPPGSKKAGEGLAKLNPNAKDFKSFFKFGGKDKNKEGTTPNENPDGSNTLQASSSTTSNLAPGGGTTDNEESPPHSRKSRDTRDTRSITTAGETSSLAESGGRNSPDLVRTPSYSNSDVAAGAAGSPNLQAKESFMAKITRKSSSSKFSLPTFARQKSRLDASSSLTSNTSTPTPAEEEEGVEAAGGMEESVGSLRDITSTPREIKDGGSLTKTASRSWSSAFKLGKKKGVESTSLSSSGDRVSGSGNEDGDEESEEV